MEETENMIINISDGSDEFSVFKRLVAVNYPVCFTSYAPDGHMTSSNSPDARILDVLFTTGGVKEQMLAHCAEKPLILSSSLGNLWIATRLNRPSDNSVHNDFFYVMGPFFLDRLSAATLQKRAGKYEIPSGWRSEFLRLVRNFPVIPWQMVTVLTITMHYILNREKITVSDFTYESSHSEANFQASGRTSSLQADPEEQSKPNMPYLSEQALLNNIRTGNTHYEKALSEAASVSSGVKIDVGDPLRRAKNSAIIFSALASRAAIEGGLFPDTAYSIQDMYVQNIESAVHISEVAAINHQMYADYIDRVHRIKNEQDHSSLVSACLNYIDSHIEDRITIHVLAQLTGYSDYYLSRRFKAETGKAINTVIAERKLEAALIDLANTNLTIQHISDRYNFCSRSYFTDQFTKTYGISPIEYRHQHKVVF